MWSAARILCLVIVSSMLFLNVEMAHAQNPFGGPPTKGKATEEPLPEYSLTETELDDLTGKTFDVVLKNGKTETGLTVKEIQRHKQRKNEVRLIEMTQESPKKTRKFPPTQIQQLVAEDQKYEVRALVKQKSFVLIDATKQFEAINTELVAQERQLWPEITAEEREKYISEDKAFLESMKTEFPEAKWNLVETDDYLFLSELPTGQAGQVLRSVDRTCEVMAKTLGTPSASGIWRGKCVIVVFATRATYQKFEQLIPPNDFPDIVEVASQSNQRQVAVRLYKDGRVIIGGFVEGAPDVFGVTLVRAVARGFLHRFRSNVPLELFIREGLADWVTGVVVPNNKQLQGMQQAAMNELKQTGELDNSILFINELDVWECGVAAGMIQVMIEADPARFQQFILQMKNGKNFQDTLQSVYNMEIENLISGYGRAVGIPNLKSVGF